MGPGAARIGSFAVDESNAADAIGYATAGPQQNRHRWPRAVRMDFAPPIAGASQCGRRNRSSAGQS